MEYPVFLEIEGINGKEACAASILTTEGSPIIENTWFDCYEAIK